MSPIEVALAGWDFHPFSCSRTVVPWCTAPGSGAGRSSEGLIKDGSLLRPRAPQRSLPTRICRVMALRCPTGIGPGSFKGRGSKGEQRLLSEPRGEAGPGGCRGTGKNVTCPHSLCQPEADVETFLPWKNWVEKNSNMNILEEFLFSLFHSKTNVRFPALPISTKD